MAAGIVVVGLTAAAGNAPSMRAAELPGFPPVAVARYEFGDTLASTVPNRITGEGALPPLTILGADYQVSGDEVRWNAGIGSFTHSLPFDPARGTFADTATGFANTFGSGGALGIRFRVDPSVEAGLGQASLVGLVTFRPNPDVNVHSTPPRSLELARGGPSDPLVLLAREGSATTGYNNQFNDFVESGYLTAPSASDVTAIVVWTPQTLRVYVSGVLAGTTARVTGDYPASSYRLFVAVNQFVVHSGDMQFFKGVTRRLVIYDRPLGDAEVLELDAALRSDGSSERPGAPRNLRIVP